MSIPAAVDPITREVISEALSAVMAEMRSNVMRAAYSSVIAGMRDFSCGLFDAAGQLIAQGPDHPGHVVPLPWGVRAAMEDLGDDLQPGDAILLNDPYRGGTHLNDVTVLWPVFHEGRLFCFPAVRAHWADVGGISPGSYTGEATNIFYEGIRIPPIKIYERGVLNRSAFALLMTNVRVPHDREGDFLACIGACRTGETRLRELLQRYGLETFESVVASNLDRAEQRMRSRIGLLPDGIYLAEDYMEFFTEGRLDPGLISLRLTIEGDQMEADFRGSSAQLPGVVNSTAAVTLAGVLIAVKSALDPGGVLNAGVFRPISCLTAPGSLVDVRFDAPANAHGEVRKRVVSVTLAALAGAIPEAVTGDLCGTSFPNVIGGWDEVRQRAFVYLAAPAGGNGGFLEGDGPNALNNVDMGGLPASFPTEEQESVYPVLVEELAIRTDSGGSGRTRGGTGVRMRIRVEGASRAEYAVTCDRAVIPPWGTMGGYSAAPICNYVEQPGAEVLDIIHTGKISAFPLSDGSTVVLQAAGGGGYGDPLERAPGLVAADVADGYVSATWAQRDYGVLLMPDGEPDLAGTAAERERLLNTRVRLRVVGSSQDPYIGIRGRHRLQRLSAGVLDRLGVEEGELIELVGSAGAPVRAWARKDNSLAHDELPLDPTAISILRTEPGRQILVRVPAVLNDASDLTVRDSRVRRVTTASNSQVDR